MFRQNQRLIVNTNLCTVERVSVSVYLLDSEQPMVCIPTPSHGGLVYHIFHTKRKIPAISEKA